jgi:hypothetical protein
MMTSFKIYNPPDIGVLKSRIMSWAGHVVRMGKMRNMSRILVGKPGGMESLEGQ